MSDRVGSIAIGVEADIAPLKRDLAKGSRHLSKFAKEVRRSANQFAKFGAAATAAMAATTAAIVAAQSKAIDALAKTSDALGIQTEKLQALNHLAELNGVSSEQMAKGLRRMERGLGEAARKGGTTADALEDAGISIQNIINLHPDQQIQKIADALGNIENQSIKASIASDLFGRDGINMLKVLTQLRKEGVEPTAAELKALGISISRIDAAKVEAANDAFFKARQVITGAANALTIELAPFIQEAADRFIDLARESGGFADHISEAVPQALKVIGKLGDGVRVMHLGFKGLEVAGTGFAAATVSALQLAAEGVTILSDNAIKRINQVIAALNKIPGVDIAKVDLFTDSALMQGLRNLGDEVRAQVATVNSEFFELGTKEMPSDAIEEFLQSVIDKSSEAAVAVSKVLPGGSNFGGGQGSAGGEKGSATSLVDSENDEFGLNPDLNPFLANQEEIREKQEEFLRLQEEFWSRNGDITRHGLNALTGMVEGSYGRQAGAISNSFASILGDTATYSKKAFEINKKVSLGQAVVKGYDAATSAWAAGMSTGGPWAPAVAAAYMTASIAKTGAQIQAIRSQKFGGGGSTSAGGGTGGVSGALPGASVPQESNARTNTIATINLQGDTFSRDSVGALIGQINDALEDGYTLRLAQ